MRNRNEHLLDAALLDEAAHDASLCIVRGAARRRRWGRYARNSTVLAVALTTAVLFLQQKRIAVTPSPTPLAREASYIVHSSALLPGFVVRTEQTSIAIVTTSQSGVEFISTEIRRPLERIDDDTLLQLVPGAALVRHQARPAELIFPSHTEPGTESRAPRE